jgi:hypothetical protein
MSALGQKQTFAVQKAMSALPPKADIGTQSRNVRFVPKADSCTAAIEASHFNALRKGRPVSFQITRYLAGRSKSRNY